MPDPENCGAIMTSCPVCRHAFELPELHYRICKLASERAATRAQVAALAGLLREVLDYADPHTPFNPNERRECVNRIKAALAAAGRADK